MTMTREEAKEILTHNWTRVDNPNYSDLSVTAILGGFNNHKDIEVIKSWYPFCEIFKTKIPKVKDGEKREE